MARNLQARTSGLLRGLFPHDGPQKVIGIRVGELRQIDRFVTLSKQLAQAIEALRAATLGAVEDESAVRQDAPKGDANG